MSLDTLHISTLVDHEELIARTHEVALAFDALGFGDEWKASGETMRRRAAKRFCFARWMIREGRLTDTPVTARDGAAGVR